MWTMIRSASCFSASDASGFFIVAENRFSASAESPSGGAPTSAYVFPAETVT